MPRSTAHLARTRTPQPRPAPAPLALHLQTLLHTVRAIGHAEDELCSLLHEVERTGALSPEGTDELRTLLSKMPFGEYTEDMEAVRSSLNIAAPARKITARKPAPKKKPARKAAKPAAAKSKARKVRS